MRFLKLPSSLILMGLMTAPNVQAEGDPLVFVDVYGGYSWSSDQDVKSRLTVGGNPNGRAFLRDLDVGNGPAFGGRIGSWLKTHPSFGVAIDATHFDTDLDRQTATLSIVPDPTAISGTIGTGDIRVSNTMVSFDLIMRHRGEKFTPYIMAGPGMMFSHLDAGGFFGDGSTQDDNDMDFAYKVGAGLSYKLSESMHLIAEYRYIHGGPTYDLERSTDPVTGFTTNEDIEIDVDTHIFSGGVSIRF